MGAGLGGTNIEDIFGSLWLSAYQSSTTITTSRPTSESSSKELKGDAQFKIYNNNKQLTRKK